MLFHADIKDSDQTGQMPRLICLHWTHRSFCLFCHAAAQFHFGIFWLKSIKSDLVIRCWPSAWSTWLFCHY